MSMYAMAAQQGISTMNLMMGGDNAGTIAAYNEAYQKEAKMYAAQDQINLAESNIASIEQDRILTNVQIEMHQANAKADAQVSAAAAGVSGGSVDAVAYGIDANASMQKQHAQAEADQLTEQQLAGVVSGSTNLSSAQSMSNTTSTGAAVAGAVGQTLGSMNESDWTVMESLWSN